jgi:hypothetical protein
MQAMPDNVIRDSNGIMRFEGPGRYAKDVNLEGSAMKSMIGTMASKHIYSDPTMVGPRRQDRLDQGREGRRSRAVRRSKRTTADRGASNCIIPSFGVEVRPMMLGAGPRSTWCDLSEHTRRRQCDGLWERYFS